MWNSKKRKIRLVHDSGEDYFINKRFNVRMCGFGIRHMFGETTDYASKIKFTVSEEPFKGAVEYTLISIWFCDFFSMLRNNSTGYIDKLLSAKIWLEKITPIYNVSSDEYIEKPIYIKVDILKELR